MSTLGQVEALIEEVDSEQYVDLDELSESFRASIRSAALDSPVTARAGIPASPKTLAIYWAWATETQNPSARIC